MTVSTAQKFDTVGYSGSAWSNYSRLAYDAASPGESTWSYTTSDSQSGYLTFSVPHFISALADGGRFISLRVDWQDKQDSVTAQATAYGKLTNGSYINAGLLNKSTYTAKYLEGDKSYWGLSGYTGEEIYTSLKDGTTKFWYYNSFGTTGRTLDVYIKDVTATLTYTHPDTKRAALIIPIA